MFHKQKCRTNVVTWKRFGHKGYSAYNSLSKQIRIGVLTVAVIGSAARAQASLNSTHPEIQDEESKDTAGLSLNEVTVTGSMAPLASLKAARIIDVITRSDIENAGVQSINDLLKLVPSVDVRQRGSFGIQTDISIDGGSYEQVTVLLNGVNISNPHTGHLATDFPLSINDIERIEVLEGAASRVYGGQAFGGAINIVTRKEKENAITIGAEGGSYGTMQANGRVSFTKRQVSNRISGGGGRSDGGTLNDAWKKGQLYYQGDFKSNNVDLDWQFGFSRKEYGANTFYSGMSNDQWEQNERYLISVGAETKGKVHFLPSIYWNRTYDNYQWHKGTPNNSHQTDVYGLKLNAFTSWKLGKTAFGAEIRNEGILSSSLGTTMDSTDFIWAHGADKQYTKHSNRTNVSYNLEHNILLNHWTISAGVLANMSTSVDNKLRFYPGIDIAYRPNSYWKIFTSYNKGFRLPSFTDLYYNSPDITGNNQLKPELNRSVSVGATFNTEGIYVTSRLFYSHGQNMIDYVKEKYGDVAHADNFTLDNLGVEGLLKFQFNKLLKKDIYINSLEIGYTYISQDRDSKYKIFTSLYADDYLRHKLTITLNHKIWKKLSATWSMRYQKRMGNYQVYDGLKPTDKLENYKAYTTLDIKLAWVDKAYQIYVQSTNTTNVRYQDLGNIKQPGIWIMAGCNIKFKL